MTDKLKCPFCGTELNDYPDKTTGARMAVCRNPKCKYDGWHFPVEIIQRMIAGKKAQDALKVATDCIESIGGTWRDGPTWTNDDMGEIRVNIEGYCDSILKKIKEVKK